MNTVDSALPVLPVTYQKPALMLEAIKSRIIRILLIVLSFDDLGGYAAREAELSFLPDLNSVNSSSSLEITFSCLSIYLTSSITKNYKLPFQSTNTDDKNSSYYKEATYFLRTSMEKVS
ncbi:hypothetical protein SAMD00020551_2688 [Mesobacillus selenatarsenatis SF-1]|uniref:Uncharacterized protein n=1 Tax=Mesobacillus selenatarsenatis (strain DSM 18680 / JCM 14380 / FERM P-15431 / SF-1) TaxID=1321606 RepID=A0A0A8X667_MESS1|nr:hypothetical protein SAMD00020551_2688 [Mesobacillus selenatarsenatis SF-1]